MAVILERAAIVTGNSYVSSNVLETELPFVKSYEVEWLSETPASKYSGTPTDMLADYSIPSDAVVLQLYSSVVTNFLLYVYT